MSNWARFAIGTVSLFLGMLVFQVALMPLPPPPTPAMLFTLSACAFCIAIACYSKSSRPVTLRIIGVMVCIAGCFAVSYELKAKAIGYLALITYAIPMAGGGAWLAITGKYPFWGAYGSMFKMIEKEHKQADDESQHRNAGPMS